MPLLYPIYYVYNRSLQRRQTARAQRTAKTISLFHLGKTKALASHHHPQVYHHSLTHSLYLLAILLYRAYYSCAYTPSVYTGAAISAPPLADSKQTSTDTPLGLSFKPSSLPPIRPKTNNSTDSKDTSALSPSSLLDEFNAKKQQVDLTLKENQQQILTNQNNEDKLRIQVSTIDPIETEKRAKFMSEQRAKLIALKKAEREGKVEEEDRVKAAGKCSGEEERQVEGM